MGILEKTSESTETAIIKVEDCVTVVPKKEITLKVDIRLAKSVSDIIKCQYFIASIYNKHYRIFFSHNIINLNAKIEPYPHAYLMATINGKVVGAAGIYLQDTYVESFGNITDSQIMKVLESANCDPSMYSIQNKREVTKIVSASYFNGHGIGALMMGIAHSKNFLYHDKPKKLPILVCCAKLSTFEYLKKHTGITPRPLAPFPKYKVHELYRNDKNPMESRVIIPHLDIPKKWYDLNIPTQILVSRSRVLKWEEINGSHQKHS